MALSIFQFDELSSTQDKAFELFELPTSAPFVVVANRQTHGRGRLDREWTSEVGRSLTMSIAIEAVSKNLEGLSLVAGLGVRDAIGLSKIKIKWPNDLMLDSNKVGGILIESRSQGPRMIIGIGIGLNLFSLQYASYQGIDKKLEAEDVARSVLKRIDSFFDSGFSGFQKEFESVMWSRGETARVNDKDVRILGVTDRGWLKTELHGELQLTDQGEILVKT